MNENIAFLRNSKFLKLLCLTVFTFALLSASGIAVTPNLGTFNFNVSNMTNYSSTQGYHFNVTVTNSTPFDKVWIEHNFTNTLTNYTVSTNVSNVYYYNYVPLAAGYYYIKWYANDTGGVLNNTDWVHYYQVNKSWIPITLYINGTDGDKTLYNNSNANFTANFSSSYTFNISLYTNLTGTMAPWDNKASPLRNYTVLNPYMARTYLIIANFSNQNYTYSQANHSLTLNDSRIIFDNFTSNVSSLSNYSGTQGYQFNATALNSSQVSKVWIRANFSGAFANYTATNYGGTQFYYNFSALAAGSYVYTWWANNTLLAYFNSSNQTFEVNKSTIVSFSLTLNGTADDSSYLNNTAVNLGNSTTPGYINSSLSFYYNTSASSAWTLISSPQNWNIASLPAGVYWVSMNFTGDQNYSSISDIWMLTLNDSRIIFSNFSSNVSTMTNYSSTQGYQFNVTALNSSQVSKVWIRANFSGAFANYTASNYDVTQFYVNIATLAAGNYTYTWCANNTLLAYFNSSNQTFQVNQGYLPITLYINGTNDDSTAYNSSVANLTANFSTSYTFNITLWTNLTGGWTLLDNEPSPVTNYTDLTPYQTANYSVIANWTGNANYTISSANHSLALTVYTAPPTPPASTPGGGNTPGPSQGGQQTVTFVTIEAGVASIARYTDKLLDVREINITVSNPANTVKITVSKVDEQPAAITHSVTGTVYKYFNITTQNLDESNVAKARLKFRVNKTWFTANNMDPATTKLNRYTGSAWQALKTTRIGNDSNYYNFEAETPGFSIFVVTASEKSSASTPTACARTCPAGQSQRAYPDCSCYTTEAPEQPSVSQTAGNYDWVIYILVVAAVTVLFAFLVLQRAKIIKLPKVEKKRHK